MNAPIRDLVVPNSIRVEVRSTTYVTVRCGRCAAEHDTCAEFRTSRCPACGRVCRLVEAAEVGSDVTPIRRRA